MPVENLLRDSCYDKSITYHAMLDFDQNKSEAWTALRIIWKYDFNYICFVGRPNPPMMYFRR
jgi:hypothetical protein